MSFYVWNCVFTECETGYFGRNCTEVCGFCIDGEPCHNVEGTCKNGCDQGYQGLTCTEGNIFNRMIINSKLKMWRI